MAGLWGTTRPKGTVARRIIRHASGPTPGWRLSNLPNWWRGWWRMAVARALRIPTYFGVLEATVICADGRRLEYGVVSYRLVTNAFVNALATYMFDGSGVNPTAYDFHDAGTGVGAEAAGDTALGTPFGGARVSGTASNPSANVYRTVATVPFTGTLAITEHGVFSALNVVNGDSIQFTYSLTLTAGG